MNSSSVYGKLAGLITAQHLQSPLGPTLSAETRCPDAEMYLSDESADLGYNPMDRISLVCQDNAAVGWCGYDSFFAECNELCVRDVMDPIPPSQIISAGTTFYDAVELFATRTDYFFLVLDGASFTGTLHFTDLLKQPGPLCLFAVTSELETVALDLCCCHPSDCWNALSTGRQEKALGVFGIRSGKLNRPTQSTATDQAKPFIDWLSCTMFIDKARMIAKRKLLPDRSSTELHSLFRQAEQVRNACAHPAGGKGIDSILDRNQLWQFIQDCHGLIGSIRAAMPNR